MEEVFRMSDDGLGLEQIEKYSGLSPRVQG
jgi:hypothetical protein